MKLFKKLNSKGFGHLEVIVLVAVVVVLAAVGGLVYEYSHHKAHANSYTTVDSQNGYTMLACKSYINAYGGVWDVQVQYYKPASSSASYNLIDVRGSQDEGEHLGSSWLYNEVASLSYDISAYYGDKFQASIPTSHGTYSTGVMSVSQIDNCSSGSQTT